MPADDANLETAFTATDYTTVATDDGNYVNQSATSENWIFEFKNQNTNNTDKIKVHWNGQTDIAPSSSTVYLQIYNRSTSTWVTLTSDSATAVDTDFNLDGTQFGNVTDYYDASNWISCRVYQEAM